MSTYLRQVLRRKLKAAADKARLEADKVERSAEELAADARALAEKARAEFVAAFHRFNATLHELEGHSEGAAAAVVEAIKVPDLVIEHALDRAGVDLEAEAAKARAGAASGDRAQG